MFFLITIFEFCFLYSLISYIFLPKNPTFFNLKLNYSIIHPFFSIMIPVYNKLKYLNRSFTSILCQNFRNFEIVVVDDCSTDGSLIYLENFFFLPINLVKHSQNLGTLYSRVDAIKASRGQYLISLDPDDELVCGLFSVLYSYLCKEHYDIIEYQYYYYTRSGKKIISQRPKVFNQSEFKYLKMNKTTLFKIRWPWNWSLWRKCFHRLILLKGVSFIPQKLFDIHLTGPEDLVIFYYSVVFCEKYIIINYFGYYYYQEQKDSAGVCGYFSCQKKKEMEKLARFYAKSFLNRKKEQFNA